MALFHGLAIVTLCCLSGCFFFLADVTVENDSGAAICDLAVSMGETGSGLGDVADGDEATGRLYAEQGLPLDVRYRACDAARMTTIRINAYVIETDSVAVHIGEAGKIEASLNGHVIPPALIRVTSYEDHPGEG